MMSDIEDTVEVETSPAHDLIQAALDQNYTAATEIFNNQIQQKMFAALEQEKINIASRIYNDAEEDDYEADEDEVDQQDDADYEEDVELSDEEIEEIDLEDDEEQE